MELHLFEDVQQGAPLARGLALARARPGRLLIAAATLRATPDQPNHTPCPSLKACCPNHRIFGTKQSTLLLNQQCKADGRCRLRHTAVTTIDLAGVALSVVSYQTEGGESRNAHTW